MSTSASLSAPPFLKNDVLCTNGFWHLPEYKGNIENWNELAKEDAVHAAISATSEEQERKKGAEAIELIRQNLTHESVLLDVGCGYGRVAKYLLPTFPLAGYVGVDSSRVMLTKFFERYERSSEEQKTPLTLVHGDIQNLPLKDNSVDCAIVSAVFLHNPKEITQTTITEIRRVLKPGGKLVIVSSFPNVLSLTGLQGSLYLAYLHLTGQGDKNGPVRYFYPGEVRRLLKDFQSTTIIPAGFSFIPKTLLGAPAFLQAKHEAWIYRPVQNWLKAHAPAGFLRFFCAHHDTVSVK